MASSSSNTQVEVVEEPEVKIETWREKLITHEDAYHHHKILGVVVVLSSFARFCLAGVEGDFGFRSYPNFTFPSLLIHFLLNASSFQFKIPPRRIKDGLRIWPEYRMHSALFAYRSIVIMALYHIEKVYNLEPDYNLNFFIVIAFFMAVDIASWSVGKFQSQSVRGVDGHPASKFFFSFMQFHATAGLLFGLRRFGLPFLMMFVVQTTPFMATLRRKNIFTTKWAGLFIYGAMLVFSGFVVRRDNLSAGPKILPFVRTIGQIAALQRMTPLPKVFSLIQNKYVVWCCAFGLLTYIRPRMDDIPVEHFELGFNISFAACLCLGAYKTQQGLKEDKKKKIKSV